MPALQKLFSLRKKLLLTIFLFASALYGLWLFRIESYPREFVVPGKIDQCCCEGSLIKDTNRKIRPIMRNLTVYTFLEKHFKVNLENECPFWAQDLLCTSKNKCGVCKCDDNEIPLPWREQEKQTNKVSYTSERYVGSSKGEPVEPVWHAAELEDFNGVYVDLVENHEEFTGYQGQRIWGVIYEENCFHGKDENKCLEERIFYRMISGLHSSIATQLSWFYIDFDLNNKRYNNVPLFFEKVGNYPDRMRNLYFTYSVLLRAINVAAESIKSFEYNTGMLEDDVKTEKYIFELLNQTVSSCSQPFDETEVFQNLENEELKRQFISYFHNITRLMDCVECEKCKVYGKMQTLGIATALKILFNERLFGKKSVSLQRNELIALINTFNKISSSVEFVDAFHVKRYENAKGLAHTLALCVLLFTVFVWIALKAYLESQRKLRGKLRESFKHYKEE